MNNPSYFESIAEAVVLESYRRAYSDEMRSRQAKCQMRISIYHDDWEGYLDRILRRMFCADTYESLKLMPNTSQNLFKQVVDQTARIYHVSPDRTTTRQGVAGADGEPGKSESVDTPYNQIDLDETMQLGSHYLRALKDVGFYVSWDEDQRQCRVSIITGSNCVVIPRRDYPQDVEAVYWRIESGDRPNIDASGAYQLQNTPEDTFLFWSKDRHFMFRQRRDMNSQLSIFDPTGLTPQDPGSNPEMVNPYGIIPISWAHEKPRPGMFWNPTDGEDLVRATIFTAIRKTLKDHTFKHNSFKRLVMTMPSDEMTNDQINDPAQALVVETGGSANVLDLQANFSEIDAAIQADIDHVLDVYGLKMQQGQNQSRAAQSALALEIKNEALKEFREMMVKVFRRVESELFDIIRTVHNYNAKRVKGIDLIPDDVKFSIEFNDIGVAIDPVKEREEWDYKRANGLCSPAQYYQHFNPDCDDPEKALVDLDANMTAWGQIEAKHESPFDVSGAFYGMANAKKSASGAGGSTPVKSPDGMAGSAAMDGMGK